MSTFSVKVGTVLLASVIAFSSPAFSQDQSAASYGTTPPATPAATPYSQAQLSQMLAPIALYPDPLIGQVLMASTYPLEIVEASRWLQASGNASLQGDQLTQALDQQPWDPSVKALVPFPQVLHMMDQNIQWTEQLGDAFLAQQSAVMDSVQQLRQEAQNNGTLASGAQQTVSTDGSEIVIEPTNPNVVYVPAYDPSVVYGGWPYTDYPPYSFYPSGYYFGPGYFGFGIGIGVIGALWGWDHWDWYHHRMDIDNNRFANLNRGQPPITPGVWQHNPAHRLGVPYRNAGVRARFQSGNSLEARRDYRGYAAAAPRPQGVGANIHGTSVSRTSPGSTSLVSRPVQATTSGRSIQTYQRSAPEAERSITAPRASPSYQRPTVSAPVSRPATPMFESFSRGPDVRSQAMRGAQSRAAPAAAPHTAAPSGGHSSGSRDTKNVR